LAEPLIRGAADLFACSEICSAVDLDEVQADIVGCAADVVFLPSTSLVRFPTMCY
jgi:hypothetical protein